MDSQAKSKHDSGRGRRSITGNTRKAAQVGAKEAIGTFCLLLNQHGTVKLSPEELRQAKFDRHEAIPPMWELLHQLSLFTLQDEFPKSLNPFPLTTNPEETIQTIKDIMWWHGYRCLKFYNLTSDLTHGSQELLLAIGWLIAKTGLISKLVASHQVPFIGGDTAFLHMQILHSEDKDVSNEHYQAARNMTLSPSGLAKQLAWMAGRCKMTFRGLHMKQQELCHLNHQIHVATQGVSISNDLQHLSLLETFLLRHSNHMQKYQDMLHTEVLRLQTCVKWREQDHVFWQWMESVVDAKLSSNLTTNEGPVLDNFMPSTSSGISIQTSRDLQQASKELSNTISQIQDNLKDLPDETQEEISEKIELIKQEIAQDVERTVTYAIKPKRGFAQQKQPIRLQYIPTTEKGAKSSKIKAQPDHWTVKEEIAQQETFVQGLELQHKQLRDKLRHDMDMISNRLVGAVCVPPIGQTNY